MRVEIGPRNTPAMRGDVVYVDCVSSQASIKATWGADRLPFDDNSADYIYASHVIEHVPWFNVAYALAEAYRVVNAGGSIELWSPDFAAIVNAYLAGSIPEKDTWRRDNHDNDLMKWVNGRLFAYFDDTNGVENLHKSAHDFRSLSAQLTDAGFVDIVRAERQAGHNPHGPCEFGIIAINPAN